MNRWQLLLTIYLTDLMMGKGETIGYKARKNLIQFEIQIQDARRSRPGLAA